MCRSGAKLIVKERYNHYSVVLDSGWTASSETATESNMNSQTVHIVKTTVKRENTKSV